MDTNNYHEKRQTNFSIDEIKNVFKLPIHYLKDKHTLEKNIHCDLELTELKDNSNNCLYDNVFEPKNQFSKITTRIWCDEFTTDKPFLKESQNLFKNIKNVKKVSTEDVDELIDIYNEIKNDYSFKERYNYIDWKIFEKFNTNSLFLLILSLVNITSPIFSLILPIILLCIPFFILKFQGAPITLSDYCIIISKFGKILPFVNILNFQSMTIDKKIMASLSIVFYFFSTYQNILHVFRFHKNMILIHKYLFKIKEFNATTIHNIDNFLSYSTNYNSYSLFNDELQKHKINLCQINENLNTITPYSMNITKIFNFGNIMKNFYSIYNDNSVNISLLYSFGFYGYLENIITVQSNINNNYLHNCKFTKKKLSFKKAFYGPLKHDNPITNDYNLNKNMVITGPNAAGKTTILKTTIINIILSQQIGCGFYKSANISPFNHIHCYLNIPDTSNRDSLFQAEARRCKNIIDIIDSDKTKKHFCIFDELYSGTNPYEAVASAFSYLSYLCKNKNIKFMLTTHYVELCKHLTKHENKKVINKHMKVNKNKNGDFDFTYMLTNNISEIKGGIKVLKDLHYPTSIIDYTEKMINEE